MLSTSTKVWIFLIVCNFALLILGYQLAERMGLLLGLLLAIAINLLIFFYGENHILSKLKAVKIKGQDAWGLNQILRQTADELGTPQPLLYVFESPCVTAFNVSILWRHACICVSSGLLKKLSQKDLYTLITHQLCHLQRMDTFGFGVTSVIANTLLGLGQFLDSFWLPNLFLKRKQKPFLTLFSPLGWFIIKFVVHKKTFFENDATAAEVLGDRQALGEILWRLEGLSQTLPLRVPPCTSHLFIVNPEGLEQRNVFLKAHPNIELRLQKLLGYYPI